MAQQVLDIVAATADEVTSWEVVSDAAKQQIDTMIKDNFVTMGENMQVLDVFVT
jgi:predicted Fe-S protein YdhL (DUF1289 family)